MWNFEDESKFEEVIKSLEKNKMILKPNREGGGNNTYD